MEYLITTTNGELYHHGIKGQKWGVRRFQNEDGSYKRDAEGRYDGTRHLRGHSGPGKYLTKKRQLAGDKRDLDHLNNGGHLSKGLTKKRQEKLDARDKAALEKRIAKNEAESNDEKKGMSDKTKRNLKIAAVVVGTAAVAAGTVYAAKKFDTHVKDLAGKKYEDAAKRAIERYEEINRNSNKKFEEALNAFEAGDRNTYHTKKKEAAKLAGEYAKTTYAVTQEKNAAKADITKSFKKSFDEVYGKKKRSIPSYELKSMGIETIDLNHTPVNRTSLKRYSIDDLRKLDLY